MIIQISLAIPAVGFVATGLLIYFFIAVRVRDSPYASNSVFPFSSINFLSAGTRRGISDELRAVETLKIMKIRIKSASVLLASLIRTRIDGSVVDCHGCCFVAS